MLVSALAKSAPLRYGTPFSSRLGTYGSTTNAASKIQHHWILCIHLKELETRFECLPQSSQKNTNDKIQRLHVLYFSVCEFRYRKPCVLNYPNFLTAHFVEIIMVSHKYIYGLSVESFSDAHYAILGVFTTGLSQAYRGKNLLRLC